MISAFFVLGPRFPRWTFLDFGLFPARSPITGGMEVSRAEQSRAELGWAGLGWAELSLPLNLQAPEDPGELVGAGGAAAAAVHARKGVGGLGGGHAFEQAAYGLEIAVAAAGVNEIVDAAFGIEIEIYLN